MTTTQRALVRTGIAAITLGFAPGALATTAPFVLQPVYTEPYSAEPPKPVKPCPVRFTALTDRRHDPSLVGILGKRSVQAPQDMQAWMRSIVGGLERRGIAVQFAPAGEATASATFDLNMVWIMPVGMNYSANVLFGIDARGSYGQDVHAVYRGRSSHVIWANADGEKAGAINSAIADALDRIAPDLHQLCAVR